MSARASIAFFVFGIVLLIVGLFLYLTWWYFAYGMAAVFLGAVLVFVSRKSWLLKSLAAGIPVLFVAWSFSRTFAAKQTILIPESYRGMFCIVYGQPCGSADEKVDGRFVVEIPANGIAIIQRDFHSGWVDDEYYFVDEGGKRTRAQVILFYPETGVASRVVMMGGSGASTGPMPDGSLSSESPESYRFTEFHVFDSDSSADASYAQEQALLDSAEALVKRCRAGFR